MYTLIEERLVTVDGGVPPQDDRSHKAHIFDPVALSGELTLRLADGQPDLLYLKPDVIDSDGEVAVRVAELQSAVGDLRRLAGADAPDPERSAHAEQVARVVERVCEVLNDVGTTYAQTLATELRVTSMDLLERVPNVQ